MDWKFIFEAFRRNSNGFAFIALPRLILPIRLQTYVRLSLLCLLSNWDIEKIYFFVSITTSWYHTLDVHAACSQLSTTKKRWLNRVNFQKRRAQLSAELEDVIQMNDCCKQTIVSVYIRIKGGKIGNARIFQCRKTSKEMHNCMLVARPCRNPTVRNVEEMPSVCAQR